MTTPARFTAAAILADLHRTRDQIVRMGAQAEDRAEADHYGRMAAGVEVALDSARALVASLSETAKR
ncbi:MAG: hypothetical protein M3O91_09715 [Chloroflexota bacterium]|nr:hypothetical protein [Chloroflexota bacterium]